MEKVRPWCSQPSDRGRLKNRTEPPKRVSYSVRRRGYLLRRKGLHVNKTFYNQKLSKLNVYKRKQTYETLRSE